MRFYRRPAPVRALSFDLDDTLYDNGPVLVEAEIQLLQFLGEQLERPEAADPRYWRAQKRASLGRQPELIHDTTAWRIATLRQGIGELLEDPWHGDDQARLVDEAMTLFLRWRNAISVPAEIVALLQELAQRYPLAVITNGNADVARFLPQVPFDLVLSAGQHGPQKPAPDLFIQCCQGLGVAPAELLHVGDHPNADVRGAIEAGCQAAWLDPRPDGRPRPAGICLPTLALSDLSALRHLP